MKIGPLTEAIRSLNTVREKRDGGGGGGNAYEEQPKKREKEEPEVEVTPGSLDRALEEFKADSQAQANGLNAIVDGRGPGLRVVLKDGSGAVVRQFTGEEFLKLRDATTKNFRSRGKILDQKL